MIELEYVLKTSKTGKAQDLDEMVRELFRPNMIESDLLKSLVCLLNKVKESGVFRKFMRKNSHFNHSNEGGIKITSKK